MRQRDGVEHMGRVNLKALGTRWFGEVKDTTQYDVSTDFEKEKG